MNATRCNLRRFPLPVSGRSADECIGVRALLLVAVAMFSAGCAVGVLGYSWANLHGLLP